MNEPPRRPRGMYLLPNLFTTGAMFAGFYAIVSAMGGRYEHAAVAIFIAMAMDGLDGRVARLTNTQSEFGVQYDSLSDLVSFGVAPALVMYQWALKDLDPLGVSWAKFGWLAAFVYAACAALRLARFNTQTGMADKRYFQGLASPAAAAVIAGVVWVADDYGFGGADLRGFAVAIPAVLGLLMVSNFRYYSFKDIDLRRRIPFLRVLVMVAMLVFAAIDPALFLLLLFSLYAVSGPILTLDYRRRKRAAKRRASTTTDNLGTSD